MVMMRRRLPAATQGPKLTGLKDLTRLVQRAEGFHPLVAALKNGLGATVDGAWGSSASLAAAALGLHASQTLLIVVAHPRDVDSWADDIETFTGERSIVTTPSGVSNCPAASGRVAGALALAAGRAPLVRPSR